MFIVWPWMHVMVICGVLCAEVVNTTQSESFLVSFCVHFISLPNSCHNLLLSCQSSPLYQCLTRDCLVFVRWPCNVLCVIMPP